MSQRIICLCLALLFMLIQSASAEGFRFKRGEAIINLSYHTPNTAKLNISPLSFEAIQKQTLSEKSVRVSVKRKSRKAVANSERYLKSRNPCNSPVIKRLLRTSGKLICEPNWEAYIALTPNDTNYSSMYSASTTAAGRIHLPEAWDLSTGSSSTVVGVIDTGIDYTHPDLQANMWVNPGEVAANGVDDDGNGYIDDIHGIDTHNGDSVPLDDQSHGTHVAGTIGAVGNNSRGVAGINWSVKQIACKSFGSSGTGSLSNIVLCLNYMKNLKNNFGINIVVTNNSYGGFPYTTSLFNAISALRDAGIVFVAGAGNDSKDNEINPFYPASHDINNIISVGATDSNAVIATFSNYGATTVDISAPGVNVLSTIPGNNYAFFNGTSMATPHVAGAIALLRSYKPDYTYYQAIDSVLHSGTVIAGLSGKNLTGSILNVAGALNYVSNAVPPVVTSAPTTLPITNPTATPSVPDGETDLKTAKLEITAVNSQKSSLVTCGLSALKSNSYQALPDYKVTRMIKGVKKVSRATTDEAGIARFTIKPPKGKTYIAHCMVKITDPNTSEKITVKSKSVSLMRAKN